MKTPIFQEKNTWIFDLDNTIYAEKTGFFPQIERRMGLFIAERLNLSLEDARERQKVYFYQYGTSLKGLMMHDGIDADDFLDYVHDIDHGVLEPNPRLDQALTRLEGKKYIFTNGPHFHVEKVLNSMGLSHHFQGVFDIFDANHIPKPQKETYHAMIKKFGVDPKTCVFFEDSARNLMPAHDMGMGTVLIETECAWASEGKDHPNIHHKTPDLAHFLEKLS